MAQVVVSGGAVTFSELVGVPELSREINATADMREETRVGLIAWLNIDALFLECWPAAPALPGVHPSLSYMYVRSVNVKPFPAVPAQGDLTIHSTNVNYLSAIVTVQYAPLDYDSSDLLDVTEDCSDEVYLLPSAGVAWSTSNTVPVQQADLVASKNIQMRDISINFHNVASSAIATKRAAIQTAHGKVNSSTYRGSAAETLLYKGSKLTWTRDSSGGQRWTMSNQFQERRNTIEDGTTVKGWNTFFDQSTGEWKDLVYLGTTEKMYKAVAGSVFDALIT